MVAAKKTGKKIIKNSLESQLKTKVERYHTITQQALQKIGVKARKGTKEHVIALDYLDMAQNYFNDAKHFQKNGELLLALAAFSYAHAWMDAGVRAGILDGKEDDRLFTLP